MDWQKNGHTLLNENRLSKFLRTDKGNGKNTILTDVDK